MSDRRAGPLGCRNVWGRWPRAPRASADKAGADAYFEVGKKYSSVGVTVLPVRVASLEQFGSEADVGKRLVDAEVMREALATCAISRSQLTCRGNGWSVIVAEGEGRDAERGLASPGVAEAPRRAAGLRFRVRRRVHEVRHVPAVNSRQWHGIPGSAVSPAQPQGHQPLLHDGEHQQVQALHC